MTNDIKDQESSGHPPSRLDTVKEEHKIRHGALSGAMKGIHAGTIHTTLERIHDPDNPNSKKNKEKKHFEELLKMALETPHDVAELLEGLSQLGNEVEASIKKAKSYKDAYDKQDITTLTLLLEEDGINVEGLTDREKIAAGHEQILANLEKAGKDIERFKEGNNKILDSDVARPEQMEEAINNLEKAAEWEKEIKGLQPEYSIRETQNDGVSNKDTEVNLNESATASNLRKGYVN